MEITRYYFEDQDGNMQEWDTDNYREAVEHATRFDYALYAYTFEYTDKELLQTPASWAHETECCCNLCVETTYQGPMSDYEKRDDNDHA